MSPLQIKILLHYWSHCDDFNEGDFSAPTIRHVIDDFAARGLLLPGARSKQYYPAKYHGNQEALEPYVRALESVPLPIQQWVIPS